MADKQTIRADPLPNIPWEDRQEGCTDVIWRSSRNPVIPRRPMPGIQGIYNSAVVSFDGAFVGVFRTESRTRFPFLHLGRSKDGIKWEIEPERIRFKGEKAGEGGDYAYDPRVCKIDDTYYITWCTGLNGPTIGVAATEDFKAFRRLENAFLPFNRNGVMFPRKINGKYARLDRPKVYKRPLKN